MKKDAKKIPRIVVFFRVASHRVKLVWLADPSRSCSQWRRFYHPLGTSSSHCVTAGCFRVVSDKRCLLRSLCCTAPPKDCSQLLYSTKKRPSRLWITSCPSCVAMRPRKKVRTWGIPHLLLYSTCSECTHTGPRHAYTVDPAQIQHPFPNKCFIFVSSSAGLETACRLKSG